MATEKIKGLFALASDSKPEVSDGEKIAGCITELIGWTPLVDIKKIPKLDGVTARLVGKLEFYQPLSSVKDRIALSMIEDAEKKGLITPGVTTLLEPTGGNTGISLALVAIQKGYKLIAIMPANCSLERRIITKYLGAEVVLTDPELGLQAIYEKIEKLKKRIPNAYMLDQFANPANIEAHFSGTGPEIWRDTDGKVDILVCGGGTGGTMSGAGRYLKTQNPSIKVVCVEPEESRLLSGGQPGSHKIQGLGPSIIPATTDFSIIDEIVAIPSEEAIEYARRLAREEGLFVGISSGAAFAASLKASCQILYSSILSFPCLLYYAISIFSCLNYLSSKL